jgi:hypothetical protein
MDDNRLQRIWEEIIEEGKKSAAGRREGEITIYDYMEQTGQSQGQAKKSLNNLIAQGRITVRRKVYVNELKTAVNLYVPVIK